MIENKVNQIDKPFSAARDLPDETIISDKDKHILYLALLVAKLDEFKCKVVQRDDIDGEWVLLHAPSNLNAFDLFCETVSTYAPEIYSSKKSARDMIREVEEYLNE